MIIRWTDIGRPHEPGAYDFSQGKLMVGADQIKHWHKNPLAAFYVVALSESKSPGYRLSQFEAAVRRPD